MLVVCYCYELETAYFCLVRYTNVFK